LKNTLTKAEIENFVAHMIESRMRQAIEEFVDTNEIKLKELSLVERVIRVEEDLRSLRESSDRNHESLLREMNARFEAMNERFGAVDKRFEASDKRFESMQREMNARFEAVDMRFESLQREMNARFEAMDKRFTSIQWMIGLFVGVPAFILVIIKLLEVLK